MPIVSYQRFDGHVRDHEDLRRLVQGPVVEGALQHRFPHLRQHEAARGSNRGKHKNNKPNLKYQLQIA